MTIFCPGLSGWLLLCSCLTCLYSYHAPFYHRHAVNNRVWREEWYNGMPIDHFSYSADDDNRTFDLRYLVNDTWWDPNGGPIFFYTGNEGPIEDFATHTGLMWDWAPEFRAMLVFAEHRYYGQSLPFGNQSFEMPYLSKLAVDQALADFGLLLAWIKSNMTGAATSPVIAFGGSYGGMLAAWSRVEHPNLVTGAIASSAPIMGLPNGGAPCHSFGDSTVRAMAEMAPGCDTAADNARRAITNMSSTEQGRQKLHEIFNFCNDSLVRTVFEGMGLRYFVTQTWPIIAMFNYPYALDFIRPLPAYPLREVCQHLVSPSMDDETLLSNTVKALLVAYNSSGTWTCFSWRGSTNGQTNYEALAWYFQNCADLLFNNECNTGQDIFKPYLFNADFYSDNCYEAYKVRPRWEWLTINYGLQRIRYSSNIIFTSGHFDPWDGSTIHQDSLQGADPSLVAINIGGGAHHYDLFGSHPDDTREIFDVRDRMKSIVGGWIRAAAAKPPAPPPIPIATPPTLDKALEANMSTPSVLELQKLGPPEFAEPENLTTPNATGTTSTSPSPSTNPPQTSSPSFPPMAPVDTTRRIPLTNTSGSTTSPPIPVVPSAAPAGSQNAQVPKIQYTKR